MMRYNDPILTAKADEQLREIIRAEVEQAGSIDAGLELFHQFEFVFGQMKRSGYIWEAVFDYPLLFRVLDYCLTTVGQYLVFYRFDEGRHGYIVYAIVDKRKDYRIKHRCDIIPIPTFGK